MSILNFEPKRVFNFFEQISAVPRGSYNTGRIADFCVSFARERGLKYTRDSLNNVIIKKPASKGREGSAPVIIQGHLDMVCEKEAGYDIDFLNDGLKLKAENGYVFAEGTTLGADDGIAVAYMLAILDSTDISHPPIEAVFTSDEEVGMTGAAGIDLSELNGKTALNIDSEEEGVLTAGCAGGASVCCDIPIKRESKTGSIYSIEISGLTGGHSGIEINKGRANAAVLAGHVIKDMTDISLISINGGLKDNAIPPRSAIRLISESDIPKLCGKLEGNLRLAFPNENISVAAVYEGRGTEKVFSEEALKKIKRFLNKVPNGVQKMSGDIDGLVQTSLNLGILKTEQERVTASFSVRSSVTAEKHELTARLSGIAAEVGGTTEVSGDYPAWEYRQTSPLRELMSEIYTEQYGCAPKIEVIHAGLECGILSEKLKNPDCVSFGPNILDIHTPSERLEIASVQRVWEFILEILRRL